MTAQNRDNITLFLYILYSQIIFLMTELISLHFSEVVARKKKGFNNGFVQDLELLTVLESEYVNFFARIMK